MRVLAVTMPGDWVTQLIESTLAEREASKSNNILSKRSGGADESLPTAKLGKGLLQMDDQVVALLAGHLNFTGPNRFWISPAHSKRYTPSVGDLVIGMVTAKLSELYRVDIGCHQNASLPLSGFEGATKKNKPSLDVGSVVFARVLVANKDMEPELVCFDSNNKADGFGEVKPGPTSLLTRSCSCTLSQSLQKAQCPILEAIGKHLSFELIAGANGRFVVIGSKPRETVAITNAILQSEGVDPAEYRSIIKEMMTFVDSTTVS